MRCKPLLTIVLLSIVFTLAGCASSQDLRDRADQLNTAADRIEQLLEQNPPDQIEESVLAQAILDKLPESWQGVGQDVIDSVGDVREAGTLIASKLDEASVKLDAQADLEESESKNTVIAGLTLAETLLGTNGIIAGLAGIFWNQKRKASAATEDIVTSIEASSLVKRAISDGGGDELRKSMSPDTQKVVKKIKAST